LRVLFDQSQVETDCAPAPGGLPSPPIASIVPFTVTVPEPTIAKPPAAPPPLPVMPK